jgi:succinyl-diaminopimelate desuccinylase
MPADEILFQTHLDTAEPGHFSQWTRTQSNPFNASIYNDEMVGLGTADVKLDFLCKIEAAKTMIGRPMKTPFVLAGTFGGHIGMAGAIKLIRRKKLNARRAFVGEPTQMQLVVAGQGIAVLEIAIPFSEEERAYRRDHDLMESSSTQSKMFSGKAAHASSPQAGDNAIMKMLNYLSQLPDGIAVMDLDGGINHNSVPASAVLEIDTVAGFKDPILPKLSRIFRCLQELDQDLKRFHDPSFSPPHPIMNLGMIRTSEAEVLITGSCRLPPSVTDADYEAWMRRLAETAQAVSGGFRLRSYAKGFETDVTSDFVAATQGVLSELKLPAGVHKTGVVTEASVLSRSGIECLVWGPGQSVGNSLAPNESIKMEDLRTATGFYSRLMERFCL